MQVDRLEGELKRKAEEVEQAARAASTVSTPTMRDRASTVGPNRSPPPARAVMLDSPSVGRASPAPASSTGAEGPLRVEVAKLQGEVKSLEESEGRHRERIQTLLRQLAEERAGKDEALRQCELKQSTIDMCATEMERLEGEKKDLNEQLEVKQTSIDLVAEQFDAEAKLSASREARIAALEREMAAKAELHRAALERLGGDLGAELAASEAAHLATRAELERTRTAHASTQAALSTLQVEHANAREQHARELELKEAELAAAAQRYARELEKLEQGVAAIASGRGRLEQLKELHDEMDRKEKAWAAERAELVAARDTLAAENVALAESNASLAEVLESAGSGDGGLQDKVGAALETADWAERVKQLEEQTMRQLEVIEVQERDRERADERTASLEAELARTRDDLASTRSALEAERADSALKGDTVSSTRRAVEAAKRELSAQQDTWHKAQADLEARLGDTTAERDTLRARRAELEATVTRLESEAKSFAEKHAEEVAELTGERASLKERLNDAIQERWAVEEKLRQREKEAEGGPAVPGGASDASGGPGGGLRGQLATAEARVVELEMKTKELQRKMQDAEGEAKRARLDEQEAKHKLLDAGKRLKESQAENEKLTAGLKILTAQVIALEEAGPAEDTREMEADLAAAEELVEELEGQVADLTERLAQAGGAVAPPAAAAAAEAADTQRSAELQARVAELEAQLATERQQSSSLAEELEEVRGRSARGDGDALAALQRQLTATNAQLAEATRVGSNGDAQLDALRAELTARSGEVEQMRAQLAAAAAATADLDQLRTQLAHAQEAKRHLEQTGGGELAELRAQLEAATARAEQVGPLAAQVEQLQAQAGAADALRAELAAAQSQLSAASSLAAAPAEENPYVGQLEAELSETKLQLLAASENAGLMREELEAFRGKAEQLDETVERSQKMEAFLNELQEERNGLAARLETAEAQVATLGALLGKAQAQAPSVADEAARKKLEDEVAELRTQVSRRDQGSVAGGLCVCVCVRG